jgi:hypothetical protein
VIDVNSDDYRKILGICEGAKEDGHHLGRLSGDCDQPQSAAWLRLPVPGNAFLLLVTIRIMLKRFPVEACRSPLRERVSISATGDAERQCVLESWGLQGCCAALALAERAANVTLFDKNDVLLSRAAVANEGKISGQPSLAASPEIRGELPPASGHELAPKRDLCARSLRRGGVLWYPECLHAISTDVTPPDWATYPPEPLRSRILAGTFRALSAIVPSLRGLNARSLPEASVKGGAIVAWGKTDIYDPAHQSCTRRCATRLSRSQLAVSWRIVHKLDSRRRRAIDAKMYERAHCQRCDDIGRPTAAPILDD